MGRLSLKSRLIAINVLTVIVLAVAILASVLWTASRDFDREAVRSIRAQANTLDMEVRAIGLRAKTAATLLAKRCTGSDPQAVGGTNGAGELSEEVLRAAGIDGIVVGDAAGVPRIMVGSAAARVSDDEWRSLLRRTLDGESPAGAVMTTNLGVLLGAASPVRVGDRVERAVVAVIDIASDHALVDAIKTNAAVECTVFAGDTRASTTVMAEGRRAIGTRMENQAVLETVMRRGEAFESVSPILGVAHQTVYLPLKGWDGKPAGMLFVGMSRERIRRASANLMIWVIVTTTLVGLVAGSVTVFLARKVGLQVGTVSERLSEQARSMGEATVQVAESSASVASQASDQAASIEEISASIEEVTATVKRNTENSESARALAVAAREAAELGAKEMRDLESAMDGIKQASGDIARIMRTIDEIAFQTNILALNAAVEAARAGEAGLGFAVVADEVRSLAQRCAASARETATSIEGAIQKGEAGATISARVGLTLGTILTRSREVSEVIAQIASSTAEQNQAVRHVNEAMGKMDRATQSSAASAEESAAASELLRGGAKALESLVNDLEGLVSGGAAESRPRGGTVTAKPRTRPESRIAKWSSGPDDPDDPDPAGGVRDSSTLALPVRARTAAKALASDAGARF